MNRDSCSNGLERFVSGDIYAQTIEKLQYSDRIREGGRKRREQNSDTRDKKEFPSSTNVVKFLLGTRRNDLELSLL
jgi:hypothetical protein